MNNKLVFIYGSCVSRDAFNFAKEGSFKIIDYYARQSFISAFSHSINPFIDLCQIKSNFQRRCVERDFLKTLPIALKKIYNILLIDFIDKRFDILQFDNSYLTLSLEFRNIVLNIFKYDNIIKHNSQERRKLFIESWRKFIVLCTELNILECVRINKVYYAKYNDSGDIVAKYTEAKIDENNEMLDFFYHIASKDIPINNFLSYDDSLFIAKKMHRWTEAPFHYIDIFYKHTLEQLNIPYSTL